MNAPRAEFLDAEPLVRFSGVDKVYANGTLALKNLDLSVRPGEFVSLLGPSGCGKSTALRIVAALGHHSSGRVERPGEGADARGEIGFVFQEPHLMPWGTVFDNVYLPLKLLGKSRAAAKAEVMAVLEMVGLSGFADSYPRELSGGMRMRVSIARALVTRPRLLLMDEPFAALDEITRNKLSRDLLSIWQASGATIMFVTHSVYESVYLSSRIVVMAARPGRIIGELDIAEPYPRDEEFRLSPEYAAHCREVSALLARAMNEAA
ncbi:MAG: ABC transporter ATP-binding protein [Moraxellaceae bacterium]|nr:ABC transporter ATP-binding protein [Moraxellaceae bacterium]